MTERMPMKGGDEYDGLTKARKFLLWKSGQLKEDQACLQQKVSQA
jgi:hypothetical protein